MLISFDKPPFFLNYLKNVHLQIKTNEKVLFLTFDDGPTVELTEKLLEILDNYAVRATFFCVGENVKKHPVLFQKLISGGHEVANHSYNHLKGWLTNNNDYYENIKLARQYINSNLFRPPYGKIGFWQLQRLRKEYHIILWDVLSRDYDKDITPEMCFGFVKNRVENGSIITFHDNIKAYENVLYALPKTINHFQNLGYRFETLSNYL